MGLFSRRFWAGAAERAIGAAANSVIVTWGVADGVLNLWTVDPVATAGVAAGMAVLSLLKSVTVVSVGPKGSPSLVDDQPDEQHRAAAYAAEVP